MKPFDYTRAGDAAAAVKSIAAAKDGRFLAGGTNLLDLMKDDIMSADMLVDLTRSGLDEIREVDGGLMLGALAKNSETANHPLVRKNYPLLSQAMLAAASAQIRNMATNGGNILQRTRCAYFYDTAMPCNKRTPGSGCSAREGLNRMHAIFGASDQCVATHPSDMAVALAALEAKIHIRGADGKDRIIAFRDFHRLPGDHPERDNTLEKGDLITAIALPPAKFTTHTYYLKVRDRASYAFALVSVAAALEITDGKIKSARIALGGVAHKPWRVTDVEDALVDAAPSEDVFEKAAALAVKGAEPLEHNRFKVELTERAIVRALSKASRLI